MDRYNYAKQVTQLEVPLFYKCHIGFSCGMVLLMKNDPYSIVLTIGPFYIEDTIDILYSCVSVHTDELNLHITEKEKEIIKSLPRLSLDSAREVLLWTKESFQSFWNLLFKNEIELKSRYIDIDQYFEKFDKARTKMFLVAIQMKNKRLMGLILQGKGEELYIQQRKLQEVKFSIYTWVMSILSSFATNSRVEVSISKEKLLMFKEKLFSEEKSLKIFIRKIIKMVSSSIGQNFHVKSNQLQRFEQLYSALENKLMYDNSLLSIAEEIQMTPSALSHWIKRNIGINYEELLDYVQVEKMTKLLRDTNKNLSEIGGCVGIRYSSLVSEKFKRITGMSPTEYKTYFQYNLKE